MVSSKERMARSASNEKMPAVDLRGWWFLQGVVADVMP